MKNQILRRFHKYIVYDTLHEYTQGVIAENIPDFLDLLEIEEPTIIYQSENDEDFDVVCKIIYETQSNIMFCVDEIDMFCSNLSAPENLRKIIRYGRHSEIGFIAITRRPAEYPKFILAQSDYIISFRQFETRDIQYLSTFLPDTDKLLNLTQYHFLTYSTKNGDFLENSLF